jgi:hypothetical protein
MVNDSEYGNFLKLLSAALLCTALQPAAFDGHSILRSFLFWYLASLVLGELSSRQ